MSTGQNRLVDVALDQASLAPASPNAEHERRIALFDLKESNAFVVVGVDAGPYALTLAMAEGRLAFDVAGADGERVCLHQVPLAGLRKIVKDYTLICESYHNAIRNATPSQIEAIDMGRRALHNEGAAMLAERLAEHADLDHNTARRLFTLLCVLHMRG